jgi:hypothetical protein
MPQASISLRHRGIPVEIAFEFVARHHAVTTSRGFRPYFYALS